MTGLRDGRVQRFELTTKHSVDLEARHEGAVRAVAEVRGDERPEALRLLSGGDDGRVLAQRWNGEVETLEERRGARVLAVEVSADASRAAWALDDGTVVLYALTERKEVRRIRENVVRSLQFSGDSLALALGREDRRVFILDAQDGTERARLEETDAPVLALRWAGKDLVAALANGQVQEWSVAERRLARSFVKARDRVSSLAVRVERDLVAAGSDDGHVYLWALSSGELIADVPADAGEVLSLAFTEDDALFAAGTDRHLHRWTLAPLQAGR